MVKLTTQNITLEKTMKINPIKTLEQKVCEINARINDLYYLSRNGSINETDFIKQKDKLNEQIIKLQKENKNEQI